MNEEKTEKRNLISVSVFRCANRMVESMIKAFGGVFVYKSCGSVAFVIYYLMLYSAFQIICNVVLNKFFAKHAKLALILRALPFLAYFSLFFINLPPVWFMVLFALFNGMTNSFGSCPMAVVNGKIKKSITTKIQGLIQAAEYFGAVLITLVSSFFLDKYDSKWVALAGIVAYSILTIFFFLSYRDTKDNEVKNQQNIDYKQLFNVKNYSPLLCEALVGTYTTIEVLIPLMSYIKYSTFYSTGIISAITSLSGLVGSLIIGAISRRHNWKWISFASIIITGACVVAFAFVDIFWLACMIIAMFGMFKSMFVVPLDSVYFKSQLGQNNRAAMLANKDTYRKVFAIPFLAISLLIPTLNWIVAFWGMLQILPLHQELVGNKLSFEQNKNLQNKSVIENDNIEKINDKN